MIDSHRIRLAQPADRSAAYAVCLKTGDNGRAAEHLYADDPDALPRVFVGPYRHFEPELSLILEDHHGVCGYALAALDSRTFYAHYDAHWRPALCAQFPDPQTDPAAWTPAQHMHHAYHHPDYFCPEPYHLYPSHLHIDLLPRAQGRGFGRRMVEELIRALAQRGSTGVHLGVGAANTRAIGFYQRMGFQALLPADSRPGNCVYMGRSHVIG
jgi:ribosomal protein S18 acetylase RimI-like enzyme